MGLAKLLLGFKFKLEDNHKPMTFDKKNISLSPEKDLVLIVEKC